ncbi:hypothetical protein INT44_004959, partial [Umbelopsis vinacea]
MEDNRSNNAAIVSSVSTSEAEAKNTSMEQQTMDQEMQRIQQLQMFDDLKRLDLQQRQDDKDLLKNSALGPISPPNNNPTLKSSPSSRSLPGSRRNSGSEDDPNVLDFGNKLKLSDNEQSNIPFSMRKSPGRLLNKMPNRSMTADVNNLQHAGYKPVPAAAGNPQQHATSSFSGFLFDDEDHQTKTTSGMVPPYSDTTYITQYGDNADNYSFTPHEGYNLRQNQPSHPNRNVEPLQRRADWLNSDVVQQQSHMTSLTNNLAEDRAPASSAQAAFYGRRPSAGLNNNRSFSQTSLDPFSDGFQIRSKLNTARSASDLQTGNSNRAPSSNALAMYDNLAGDNNPVDLSANICRQHQQGYCPRGDQCPYLHTNASAMNFSPALSVATPGGMPGTQQHHVAMAAAAGQLRPMGYAGGLPMNALYQQYPTGIAFNPNNTPNPALVHPFPKPGPHANNVGNSRYAPQPGSLGHHKSDNNMYSRRGSTEHDQSNRFANVELKDLTGKIYELCKDQHGCRYLQKKLEEQNEENLNVIFNEVFKHFVELMTDPFGNYLCQKLLDYCNDEQRTIIVETVAKDLVGISLNMHGTRAVQKMIESLSTSRQIRMIIVALTPNVVTLIKDLNGNHVIQKCLHRLNATDNQFIYDAVSRHCVEVATHRHGCCVLQRCIDHASISQRAQIVTEVTHHALPLVQDPFGNYVVQYVLDLGDAAFSDALIRRFIGNVCTLSVQKFSSNVIEKCIRVSEPDTRKCLIEEMLDKDALEKLLRDSFANYVVQTSLDYADPDQRVKLVDCIRPILPSIRNTPYGKRIQGKLQRDQQQRDQQQGNVYKKFGNINNRDNVQMQNLQQNNGLPVLGFPFNYGNMGMIGMNEQMFPY